MDARGDGRYGGDGGPVVRFEGVLAGERLEVEWSEAGGWRPVWLPGFAAELAAERLRGILEFSPVGPFVKFDADQPGHVFEVLRWVCDSVSVDEAPSPEWGDTSVPPGAVA